MMRKEYDRDAALMYAERWAFARNPAYYDFSTPGGDCTSFISQCVYAGSGIMNYPDWYYVSADDRSPSWAGVEYFYEFIVNNRGKGPFARGTGPEELRIGDVIQLADEEEDWYHSLLVTREWPNIAVAAHTLDAFMRPLSTYSYAQARYLHIVGVRM